MKKVIIAILVAAAFIVCGVSFAKMGNDFAALSFVDMETTTMEIKEEFRDIRIQADIGTIEIHSCDEAICSIECYQDKKGPFQIKVEEGALVIDSKTREDLTWYERASTFASMPRAVILLPKKEYGALVARIETGDLSTEGPLSFASMDLTLDTGNVHLEDTLVSDMMQVKLDTGNFSFEDCDAGSVMAELDTGNIEGNFLSGKTIEAKSDTGNVHVPKDSKGGACKLKTDTGNIRISIAE